MPEKPIRIEADSLRALAGLLLAEIETAATAGGDRAGTPSSPYLKIREFAAGPHRDWLNACLETALENVSDAQEAERRGGELGFCRRCGGALDVDPGGETYCTGCGR